MHTSVFFFLCFYYTRFRSVYNKQKKLRDKSLITESATVKIFIKSAGVIKSGLESGKRLRHGTLNQLSEPVYDFLRILPHIPFDPVKH